jgi:hypothetical protein
MIRTVAIASIALALALPVAANAQTNDIAKDRQDIAEVRGDLSRDRTDRLNDRHERQQDKANLSRDKRLGDKAAITRTLSAARSQKAAAPRKASSISTSVMGGRSGDIIVAFKSGIATGPALPTGSLMGHSGLYRNDTAVPIVFWWQGMKGHASFLSSTT